MTPLIADTVYAPLIIVKNNDAPHTPGLPAYPLIR